MRKCANESCETLATKRYCDPCFQAHKEKLTGKCIKCSVAILSSERLCKNCNPQRKNACEKCGQSCLRRFCSDCSVELKSGSSSFSSSFSSSRQQGYSSFTETMKIKCETCGELTSNKRFCSSCTQTYNENLNICRDCNKNLCKRDYCQPCVQKFKESSPKQSCMDCGQPSYARFCGPCIQRFKQKRAEKEQETN